jgi:leucyl aminopeptidase (aminopeptidase T)
VRAGERVLVLWSAPQAAVAAAIAAAATARGARVQRTLFDAAEEFAEPPAEVADSMKAADAVFAVTQGSVSHTAGRRAATAAGTRIASLAGITSAMFARAVDVDYSVLTRDGDFLARMLTAAAEVHLTSESGTDLTISIVGRVGRNDDGDLRAPGAFGNLPAGEAYIAPCEDGASGLVVADGSLLESGLLREPVELRLRDGVLESASGAVGAALLRTLDAAGPTGRRIAELGIGTNPAARIVGEVLEDEKVRGTVHVAFGASAGIGGTNVAAVHVDAVIRQPTLEIGGVRVLDRGRLIARPGP